jgi:amino acid adenylation domain-containing protein
MVLASVRAPRSGHYIVQEVCELAESVDIDLLRDAWRIVARRHAALRTSIEIIDGKPSRLRVHDVSELRFQEFSWIGLSGEAQQAQLAAFLRQDRESGFDFQGGTPIRLAVLRTSLSSSTVIWTSHHALLDGRSYSIVWREWLTIYDNLVHGDEIQLPPPATDADGDYRDTSGAENYWRSYLGGLSQTTDYVIDRIRPAVVSQLEGIGRESVSLSRKSTGKLRDFAGHHEITVHTLILGAWTLLLSRYSGRRDVVFGVTRAGRTSPRDDASVGFFINTMPLRIGVDPESKLGPWLKQIRSNWVTMWQFEQTPLEDIWKWAALPPGMPPFESLINYQHEPESETLRNLGGRWSNRIFRRFQQTDLPLTLAAYASPVLRLDIIFDTGLFSKYTMSAASLHLKTLLESFVAQPDARLSELRMLTEDERLRLNTRASDSSCPKLCAHELFEQQVRRTPQAAALDYAEGSISYDALNRRANRLARYLVEKGTVPEDLVGVCMNPSPESVIAVLGALKAGAAFLLLDPALPADRLTDMLSDARSKFVLSKSGERPRLEGSGCRTLMLNALDDSIGGEIEENLPNSATPAHAAYAIYTSGSTGKPKAVVAPHRALVNHTLAATSVYEICEHDRRLQFASAGTDVFVAEIFNYLCCGATLVFGWNRGNTSIREFLQYLGERRITITGLPSAWWNEWMAAMEPAGMTETGMETPRFLRAVIIGMEKANPAAFLTWKRVIGPRIRLFNAYGPTETSPTATIYEAGSSAWEAESYVPIGKPIAKTCVYVLDRDGNPAPVGVTGELFIGGAGVTRGYLNSPELTAQCFVPDSFSPFSADRVYRTGDMVFYLPDGNLVFVGRRDRQVKIRGFRVELEEVEAVLTSHPEVRQCAVIATGQKGKENLVAYVTVGKSVMPSRAALRSFLSASLPEHMIPAAFIPLQEMPVTAGGKIDFQALPPCDPDRLRPQKDSQPPSTLHETRLAAIWSEVLGVSPIGATDNFFERGADSLDTTRLITLMEAQFGREIPVTAILRAPTLARMAALFEEHGASPAEIECDAIVPLQTNGSRVPLFCFPGADENPYCFLDLAMNLGPDQPFYAVRDPRPAALRGSYTVEEAAARFVTAITGVQREGPYLVGGYCYGGIVAFEAARQLVARGEKVGMLVLFDVPAPGYPKVLRNWRNYGLQGISILRRRRSITLREARSHLSVLRTLFEWKAAVFKRRLLLRMGLKRVVGPAEKRGYPALHPNTLAGRSYDLKGLVCNVVQFIAASEPRSTLILDDPLLAWREFTYGEFTVREMRGKSAEILKSPYVMDLATQLGALLDGFRAG